jgi:hypothetical protein
MKIVKVFVLCVLVAVPATAQDSLLPTLEALRAAYPVGWSHEQRGAFLNAVAFKHKDEGWGLLKKPGGNRCPTPQGIDVSCDYLVYRPTMQGFDVLVDESRPVWRKADTFTDDPERWVAPVSPGGESGSGGDVPLPPGTGAGYDLDVIKRLMVIEDKENQILLKLDAEVLAQLGRVETKVDEVGTSIKDVAVFIGKYVSPAAITAFLTWFATRDQGVEP